MHEQGASLDDETLPPLRIDSDVDKLNYFAPLIDRSLNLGLHARKALYLFAGKSRKSDVGDCLRQLGWQVLEMDILRNKAHDISIKKVQEKVRGWIRERTFLALLASPPCDSFTRAKMANRLGPRPVRDFDHPRGLPNLSWSERRTVMLANALVDFTFELFELHFAWEQAVGVLEHPEDLGAVSSGPFYMCRPASIWQFPAFHKILQLPGVGTAGLRQSDFGTEYVKPTRLLLKNFAQQSPLLFSGLPQFSSSGVYEGPIPKTVGKKSLVKRKGETGFRTTGTAAWPPLLCQHLAEQLSTLPSGGSLLTSVESEVDSTTGSSDKDPRDGPRVISPPENYWMGGKGSPRSHCFLGKQHEFHDGAGLSSPGRWNKEDRCFPEGARWDSLRSDLEKVLREDLDDLGITRLFACLATGRDLHFKQEWPVKMRRILHRWLQRQCGDYCSADEPIQTPGQPFFLDLMFYLAREMRDADYQVLKELQSGVTAGILEHLPIVPAVFEEQVKWRLTEDPLDAGLECNPNYKSVDGFRVEVLKQFRADELEGRMLELDEEVFRKRFEGRIAISALAVLQEKDKIRVLHDATHVTKVNHRIKVRCRLRMPTAKEKFFLLDSFRGRSSIAISMLGDVGKAHRLIRIKENEWGMMACQVEPGRVWVNCVGTFGVASAAFWWARLAGSLVRLTFGLLGSRNALDILLYADDLEWLAERKEEKFSVLLAICIAFALGAPLKWSKFRGGYEVSWIGLGISYREYSLGLTEARATWMASWLQKLAGDGVVKLIEYLGGLGRLNFAATALLYEKPFLGPMYTWAAAIQRHPNKSGIYLVPWAIRLIATWLADVITKVGRLTPAPKNGGRIIELFRSDARAEGGRAWIGGWEVAHYKDPKKCRWFAAEVTGQWASWIYCKKDPQRVIASLELLGTLVSVMLFSDSLNSDTPMGATLSGSTDNQGNSLATAKMMSTKYPLTVLLMEMSEQMRKRRSTLHLGWIRRDTNVEADALSNMDWSAFDEKLRIDIIPEKLEWIVLPRLMESSQKLYDDIKVQKERLVEGKARAPPKKTPAAKKLRWTDPW